MVVGVVVAVVGEHGQGIGATVAEVVHIVLERSPNTALLGLRVQVVLAPPVHIAAMEVGPVAIPAPQGG